MVMKIVAIDDVLLAKLQCQTPAEMLKPITFGEAVNLFAAEQKREEPWLMGYSRAEAGVEGELEFDDNAIVSAGDDPWHAGGAYVMSWSWVENGDLSKADALVLAKRSNPEADEEELDALIDEVIHG